MCFSSLELELMERFNQKLDLGKPSVGFKRVQIKKRGCCRGNNREKYISDFRKICVLRDFEADKVPQNHRNEISKATTVKYTFLKALEKLCGFYRANLFLPG